MPRNLDGSGHCWIEASEKAFGVLHLDELPFGDNRTVDMGPPPTNITVASRHLRGTNKSYRVRLEPPDGWTKKSDPTISFQLSSGHVNQTLYFLAEFWRMKGVPFQRITNENGNGYTAPGLQGGEFWRKHS